MNMVDKLKQQQVSRVNVEQAQEVLSNNTLSFAEKVKKVQALEDLATGFELDMFSDIYASLHNLAQTTADINLISGS